MIACSEVDFVLRRIRCVINFAPSTGPPTLLFANARRFDVVPPPADMVLGTA